MMASYIIAHMNISLYLKELGYKIEKEQRLNIYLTNTLEPYTANMDPNIFFNSVGKESLAANIIKQTIFFSVVTGNPPYSGESKNKGTWIMSLMDDYKKEPGGLKRLNERNPKMINDDYVKFIRYSQNLIVKTGVGILAFINPHGFLDNNTFRGMRWHLINTFNKLYLVDLNGNVKKRKVGINGELDENVFDITTGVSINVFVKSGKINENNAYFHELLGSRKSKYDFLFTNSLNIIPSVILIPKSTEFFLNPKDFDGESEYKIGFSISDVFKFHLSGLSTKNDGFCVDFSKEDVYDKLKDLRNLNINELRTKYDLFNSSSSWSLEGAIKDAKANLDNSYVIPLAYRPFDTMYSFYTGKSMGYMGRPRGELGYHLTKQNLSLITLRKSRSNLTWNFIGVADKMICEPTTITSLDGNYGFPLYLYPESNGQQTIEQSTARTPNLNAEIVKEIGEKIGLLFVNEKAAPPVGHPSKGGELEFAPIDILDYIYAVLHSPTYRGKYKEFLKIDFPRVPYPKDASTFWQLVKLGGELRQIHLLESPVVDNFITQFPITGTNEVVKIKYEDGKVYINPTQYFANVPQQAWDFYIGGYQPAQKWLKDRKGRILTDEDIAHYQKIIVALTETGRIMEEADGVEIE